jgi:hypothetical protein
VFPNRAIESTKILGFTIGMKCLVLKIKDFQQMSLQFQIRCFNRLKFLLDLVVTGKFATPLVITGFKILPFYRHRKNSQSTKVNLSVSK